MNELDVRYQEHLRNDNFFSEDLELLNSQVYA